jgi:hypothetical protein
LRNVRRKTSSAGKTARLKVLVTGLGLTHKS